MRITTSVGFYVEKEREKASIVRLMISESLVQKIFLLLVFFRHYSKSLLDFVFFDGHHELGIAVLLNYLSGIIHINMFNFLTLHILVPVVPMLFRTLEANYRCRWCRLRTIVGTEHPLNSHLHKFPNNWQFIQMTF